MHPLTRRALADVTTPTRQEPRLLLLRLVPPPRLHLALHLALALPTPDSTRPASKYTRHHLVPLVRGYSARQNPSSTSTWPTEYRRLHLTASSPCR
ncbi:hypothetical protein COCMIDRAFT_82938 [Bipolaris oryzae ATCC 44560]|uniref:Uncharacterized protein n=1 Tax=Bipolaris oryzae ATCC 44560 TaxID=930090 RepID=W6ZJ32_COCMI|nr:uncharacterized protein COCMIDRAFT_82938 [Bipolaris oryzae ATCC 44560]EUC50018.1 hypothetical protein COCMIDRAFT_82938 [Bipolaris oryzae ATCC 44560]